MNRVFNNKGVTIPVVLVVLLISTILGFASMNMITSQTKFNIIDDSSKKAIEYAEAGYNQYLWHLNDDVNFYSTKLSDDMQGVDISFQDGYYRLQVTKPSDTDRFITIKSTGWTKSNPDIKRTIEAKIRKKQFVHHVYVSNNEGNNIWWTSGDESHGPYHTNGDLLIEKKPIFYDTVSYSGKCYKNNGNYKKKELITDEDKKTPTTYYYPDYKVKIPQQPEKVDKLEFPEDNKSLKTWAQKDNMYFTGRTCIFLDGENIKIRNKKDSNVTTISISSIKNKVIYVDAVDGSTGKFDINAGNIFISGELKGVLTIAAANDIYITYGDPTNWYDYDQSNMKNANNEPNQPPESYKWSNNNYYSYPEKGGIKYKNTTFTASYKPNGEDFWIREANGKDMLGLVANNNIFILHYGWPKMPVSSDGGYPYWNFKWEWNPSEKQWVPSSKNNGMYDVAPKNIILHSALFAVNGGFGYEKYNFYDSTDRHGNPIYTKKGDIILWGNVTQKIRLAVGLIDTSGYNKKYAHDPRMFYDYPPHILEPVNVGWEIHDWKETKPTEE